MPSGHTIEILDNTWPSLQRAESIFGSRTESDTYRGTAALEKGKKESSSEKPKRSLT